MFWDDVVRQTDWKNQRQKEEIITVCLAALDGHSELIHQATKKLSAVIKHKSHLLCWGIPETPKKHSPKVGDHEPVSQIQTLPFPNFFHTTQVLC